MSFPVTVEVDAARTRGPYRPIWNWVGYDEPNYTYTEHGRKLLRELMALSPDPVRIRTHNLLTSGDGSSSLKWGSTNAYTEDDAGNAVYDWTIMDRIFDTWAEAGATPLVQVGFMPEALSRHPEPYRHSWSLTSTYNTIVTGWASPPNDIGKWSALVEAWARHLVERYGYERVATWPWECWNEPDGHYWTGTIPEFCAMYDATAHAIRNVLPQARVGGPHTCGGFGNDKAQAFLRGFLRHVVDHGTPLDFIGFHAKGQPALHEGHVRMGIGKQLRDIETNLAIIAEFPELRGLGVVIGESDPEGCAACSARVHPQNAYRNGPLYGVYWIESMIRTYELSHRSGIEIEGAVTWAFMFDGQPWFDGFRDLATNGVDKAVLNAMRMMGKLSGDWLETTSSHRLSLDTMMSDGVRTAPDVNLVATRDGTGTSILLWHYHDDDIAGDEAEITLRVNGTHAPAHIRHFRMDATHSNAFATWTEMGSPQDPDTAAYRALEQAGQLAEIAAPAVATEDGALVLKLALPRQGVSLLRLEEADAEAR